MLYFKDGRFHKCGASFMIPDGFYFDPTPDEGLEGFSAWAPNKKLHMELGIEESRADAKADMEDYFEKGSDLDFQVRSSMITTVVNGLRGYQASYVSNGAAFIEYRLELPEKALLWMTISEKASSIQAIMDSEYLTAILAEIGKTVQ